MTAIIQGVGIVTELKVDRIKNYFVAEFVTGTPSAQCFSLEIYSKNKLVGCFITNIPASSMFTHSQKIELLIWNGE